jgi:2-Cys peroxiredoxin 5
MFGQQRPHIDHRQIRFLADPDLRFTKALDLSFDGAAIFGGDRSKRYALVTEDATSDTQAVSKAENVLGKLVKQ